MKERTDAQTFGDEHAVLGIPFENWSNLKRWIRLWLIIFNGTRLPFLHTIFFAFLPLAFANCFSGEMEISKISWLSPVLMMFFLDNGGAYMYNGYVCGTKAIKKMSWGRFANRMLSVQYY